MNAGKEIRHVEPNDDCVKAKHNSIQRETNEQIHSDVDEEPGKELDNLLEEELGEEELEAHHELVQQRRRTTIPTQSLLDLRCLNGTAEETIEYLIRSSGASEEELVFPS